MRRVVAGVEDEQGRGRGCRSPRHERRDLLDRDGVGVLARMDTAHVERGGPTVAVEAELGQPLVGPPSHDRLPGGVARRMVVEAACGAGLGIAARPDAQIDGVDRLTVAG